MELDRARLKGLAKKSMRRQKPSVLLVSLVFQLLTTGVATAVALVMLWPMMRDVFDLALRESFGRGSVGTDEILRLLPGWLTNLLLGLVLLILAALLAGILQYGYAGYTLRLSRGERAGWHDLISGFSIAGRVLGMSIMVGIFSMLWGLAVQVPAVLVQAVINFLLPERLMWVAGLTNFVLSVGASVLTYSRTIRYSLAPLALADDPELRTFGAIRRSKEMMRGHRWEFFKMQFSFFGWYLLGGVVAFAGYYVGAVILVIVMGVQLAGTGMAAGAGLSGDTYLLAYALVQTMMSGFWVIIVAMLLANMLYMMWLQPYVSLTTAQYYLAWRRDRKGPPPPPRVDMTDPWNWPDDSRDSTQGQLPDSRSDPDQPL